MACLGPLWLVLAGFSLVKPMKNVLKESFCKKNGDRNKTKYISWITRENHVYVGCLKDHRIKSYPKIIKINLNSFF